MIKVDKTYFIGKGAHRECYRHPENKNLCIKIIASGHTKESEREKKYYKHLEKRGISWEMIPQYHGDIQTTLGQGSVFDLILDQDASISKTLGYYLSSQEKTKKYYDSLTNSLFALKKYLFDNRIITMNLDPSNILCQRSEDKISRLFIIDNVCNTEFIPISSYSNFFAKIKLSRKWDRFEKRMLKIYKDNKALTDIIRSMRS